MAQQRLMMINMDPPGHTGLRSLVNRGFTPRMIGKLEERIAGACDEIVRKAVEQREGDFVTMCSAELPLVVIAELMGVPTYRFRLWAFAICAVVTTVGAVSWIGFIGELEPIAWRTKSQSAAAACVTT